MSAHWVPTAAHGELRESYTCGAPASPVAGQGAEGRGPGAPSEPGAAARASVCLLLCCSQIDVPR